MSTFFRVFVTVAIGDVKYLKAAKRLESQIGKLNLFDKVLILTEQELSQMAPHLNEWYSRDELINSPGYGYFAWKSAVFPYISAIFPEEKFITVMYLDAGCEVLPGRRSSRIFSKMLQFAETSGVVAFKIETPEALYTKKRVFHFFPSLEPTDMSGQFQGGSWILSGDKGNSIAKRWNQIVSLGPELTNDSIEDELPNFVSPRHDQSIFSLVLKENNISPWKRVPPYPRDNFFSYLKGIRFPFWWARNPSDVSTIPIMVQIFLKLLP